MINYSTVNVLNVFKLVFIWIIPLIFLIFGIFGNMFVIAVFSRKKLYKFSSKLAYICLAMADNFCLIFQVVDNVLWRNDVNIETLSKASCKFFRYISFAFSPFSAWLLVYISVDKYISIRFNQLKLLKNVYFKIMILIFIFCYNTVYYSPVLINTELTNDSNGSMACVYVYERLEKVFGWMDLLNLSIIPFSIMTVTSLLLIYSIFKSRMKISKSKSRQDVKRLIKDVKFSITTILLNIFFIILNLPMCLVWLFELDNKSDYYFICICLFYFSFCANFCILVFSNSIFRNEFLIVFGLKRLKTDATTVNFRTIA